MTSATEGVAEVVDPAGRRWTVVARPAHRRHPCEHDTGSPVSLGDAGLLGSHAPEVVATGAAVWFVLLRWTRPWVIEAGQLDGTRTIRWRVRGRGKARRGAAIAASAIATGDFTVAIFGWTPVPLPESPQPRRPEGARSVKIIPPAPPAP